MKNKSVKKSHKTASGGTLLGMFIGLVMGVLLTCGVILYLNNAPLPFNTPEKRNASRPIPQSAKQKANGQKKDDNRFSFYEILPNKTEGNAKKIEAPAPAPAATFYVQTGSFAQPNEADNQRAQIALLGLEAQIQQIIIKDKTYYRVRLGPFNEKEAKAKHAELLNAGLSAQLVQ